MAEQAEAMRDLTIVDSWDENYSLDTSPKYLFKRTFDFVFSVLALTISLPLWLIFSLAIKIEDGGPVFYPQRRAGKQGKILSILKFRTLFENADQVVRPWTSPGQEWVTRVGRLLRATALDELPQLLNILRGDMSFVGPRAMPIEEFVDFRHKIPGLERRLSVRPGLTGLAQVYGKATRDIRVKLRYDLIYIQNQSFWLDIKLIALSFWITFRARWEHRGEKL
jgi:lipopolysaccharide/colanic/teichoic acid biosynthesis glycosyltransferase